MLSNRSKLIEIILLASYSSRKIMKNLILLLLFLFSTNLLAAPVNVNTADSKAIADALNGIGIKKADAIVKYRTENGAFATVEDLTKVKGIGQKTLEKNKKDILLTNTPSAEPAAVEPTKVNKSK